MFIIGHNHAARTNLFKTKQPKASPKLPSALPASPTAAPGRRPLRKWSPAAPTGARFGCVRSEASSAGGVDGKLMEGSPILIRTLFCPGPQIQKIRKAHLCKKLLHLAQTLTDRPASGKLRRPPPLTCLASRRRLAEPRPQHSRIGPPGWLQRNNSAPAVGCQVPPQRPPGTRASKNTFLENSFKGIP